MYQNEGNDTLMSVQWSTKIATANIAPASISRVPQRDRIESCVVVLRATTNTEEVGQDGLENGLVEPLRQGSGIFKKQNRCRSWGNSDLRL